MRALFLSFITLLSLNAFSSVAFTISGKLVPNPVKDELIHMKLLTKEGNLDIVSFDHKSQTCENGVYEVVENFHPQNTFSLIEVIECIDEKEEIQFCFEIYSPMCGEVEGVEKTFGNFCELTIAGADFLHGGNCSN